MKKRTKFILFILVLMVLSIWTEVVKSPADNSAHVYFLNVGQGDAELIQKGSNQILIDGGPDDSVLSELGNVMPITDRKIETIILTHPHSDHLIGINLILDRYEVGTVYSTGVVHTSNAYLEFLAKIKEKNINFIVPNIDDNFIPFDDATFKFLWPGQKYQNQKKDNLNDSSIVSKFCYQNKCTIFMGDLETTGQSEMFANATNKTDFQSDIIKVAHHGSSNGTDKNTLDLISPKYAVISVGSDNQFGHPHISTLNLLSQNQIEVYRTDKDGTVNMMLSYDGIYKQK